jgi:hypothetical protein
VDYDLDDATGLISRTVGSSIFHASATGVTVTTSNNLLKTGAFVGARAGMILTIDTPSLVAGTYTIKTVVDASNVLIYGTFPSAALLALPVASVDFIIDDNLIVSYEYNPASVDVIKAVRSAARTDFTITDVPLMYIDSIEILDPLSGEPTGALLSGAGGYGVGGFGSGGFGAAPSGGYSFVVVEPTLRHSDLEDNFIEFSESALGLSVRINYQYASAIPPIQAFMDDRNNQSTTASLVARHFIPVFVDTTSPLIYEIPASTSATALSADEMTDLIKGYIDDIDAGNPLEVSDLIDVLYDNGATRVDLAALSSLRSEIHNHDGSVVFASVDSTGSIKIPSNEIPDPTDKPLSPRIARFRARNISLQRNLV